MAGNKFTWPLGKRGHRSEAPPGPLHTLAGDRVPFPAAHPSPRTCKPGGPLEADLQLPSSWHPPCRHRRPTLSWGGSRAPGQHGGRQVASQRSGFLSRREPSREGKSEAVGVPTRPRTCGPPAPAGPPRPRCHPGAEQGWGRGSGAGATYRDLAFPARTSSSLRRPQGGERPTPGSEGPWGRRTRAPREQAGRRVAGQGVRGKDGWTDRRTRGWTDGGWKVGRQTRQARPPSP